MLGSCPHGTDLPTPPHPPHIQRAWDYYCAASAGTVAGGVDHWDQVPGHEKVQCLSATGGLPPVEELEFATHWPPAKTSTVTVRVAHRRTGLSAESSDMSQLRARNYALFQLADLLAEREG